MPPVYIPGYNVTSNPPANSPPLDDVPGRLNCQAGLMAGMNAKVLRYPCDWGDLQPDSPSTFNFSSLKMFRDMVEHAHQVVPGNPAFRYLPTFEPGLRNANFGPGGNPGPAWTYQSPYSQHFMTSPGTSGWSRRVPITPTGYAWYGYALAIALAYLSGVDLNADGTKKALLWVRIVPTSSSCQTSRTPQASAPSQVSTWVG